MPVVTHVLEAFPVDGDELVGEWPLEGVPVGELRAMFDRPEDDPMYDKHPVLPRHVKRLEQATTGLSLDLNRFDYFVSAYRAD
jgi:hypothetical protein